MSGKFALVIGNTEYNDPGLTKLTAPGQDAQDFARILREPNICSFDKVDVLFNQPSSTVIEAIDEFFDQKQPGDLLLLYFSGHGVRDEFGSLYLAVRNTSRSRLRSTAVKSDYIREAMDESRSKRQVVILDCCNSGAFPQGTKAAIGSTMGLTQAFQGYGRFVLTASDSTQFAWEGDVLLGETQNSLFTHYLMQGLQGAADSNGDGAITVDELYDYAFREIAKVTPKQTPTKSASKQEGEIILRENLRIEEVNPIPLPSALLDSIENPLSDIRLGAVQQLAKLLNGKNLGLVRSAREALEKIAETDDSRQVSKLATQVLESVPAAEFKAFQKAEKEQLAPPKAEAEQHVELKRPADDKIVAEKKAVHERSRRDSAAVPLAGNPANARTDTSRAIQGPQTAPGRKSGLTVAVVAVGGIAFVLIGFISLMLIVNLMTLVPGPSPDTSASPQFTAPVNPSLIPQVPVTSNSTQTAVPTRTPNLSATQEFSDFYTQLQKYRNEGYISTLQGKFVALDDYSASAAQINWVTGDSIAYDQSVGDFVLTAHFSWSTAVQTTNESGCGIWFAVRNNGDSYFAFLDKSRIYLLHHDASTGTGLDEVGKTSGTGRVNFGNPAEADFSLIVNDNYAYALVDDQFIGKYTLSTSSIVEGQLGYAVLSGTNQDYGTSCEISDAQLWITEP